MMLLFSEMLAGGNLEPEVEAVMNWTNKHRFVSSVVLYGGALVTRYPYSKSASLGNHYVCFVCLITISTKSVLK